MNTQRFSRVTLETMANYRTAAAQVVAASGAGSRRLVKAVDGAVQQQVVLRTAALVPAAGERLDAARDAAARLALQGIEQAVSRSEQAIARSSEFATAQVERWADAAAAFDNRYVVQGLEAAARLTLPAAQLALAVSGKVAEGATQLADVAGAHPVQSKVRQAAKGTRRAAAQVKVEAEVKAKAAVRRTRKAVAPVAKLADAQPVKRARRAARKAVA